MITVTNVALALTCLAANHPPIHQVGILAGRATVVLADQTWPPPANLNAAKCLDIGQAVVATVDLASPHQRVVLRHPSEFQERPIYPNRPPLRASYSNFGIFVVDYSSGGVPTSDLEPSIHGLTLTSLEANNMRLSFAIDNNLPVTNEVIDRGEVHLNLDPLRNRGGVYYDYLVNETAECEFYFPDTRDGVRCFVASLLPSRNKLQRERGQPVWRERNAVPANMILFDGHFTVVPHKKARYLVTAAGSLVKIVGADGKPLPKAEVVFDKSPIRAVVHDTDEGHWYALTATDFFEVAEPLAAKPHQVAKFDTSSGLAGLETAFHCGRAVREMPPVPFPADPADAKKKP